MIPFPLLVAWIIAILLTVVFFGIFLFTDKKLSWTFIAALGFYIPAITSLLINDMKSYVILELGFFVMLNIYFFDKYFTYYKATRRNRR